MYDVKPKLEDVQLGNLWVGRTFWISITVSAAAIFSFGILRNLVDLGIVFHFTSEQFSRPIPLQLLFVLFFIGIPLIPGVLSNLAARKLLNIDLPRFRNLSRLSSIAFVTSLLMLFAAFFYDPQSITNWSLNSIPIFEHLAFTILITTAFILACLAAALVALNLVISIYRSRRRGQRIRDLSPFSFGIFVWSFVQVIATPVFCISLLLVIAEGAFNVGIFDPRMGGDPVLFKHFIWFAIHPIALAVIIPGISLVVQIQTSLTVLKQYQKNLITRSILVFASLIFLGWGQHFYFGGMSERGPLIFGLLGSLSFVPLLTIGVTIMAKILMSKSRFQPESLVSIAAIQALLFGAFSGLILSFPSLNVYLHGTKFVNGHVGYMLFGGIFLPFLAGMLHISQFASRSNQMKWLTYILSSTVIVGLNLFCIQQFLMGLTGVPQYWDGFESSSEFIKSLSAVGGTASVIAAFLLVSFNWKALWRLPQVRSLKE